MKPQLTQILTSYLEANNSTDYLTLEEISIFRQFFCTYLQDQLHIAKDQLDGSFRRWCRQLSSGRAFPEARRFVVYILWYRCELKQYHIARLLGVSTRTIRRDMRIIEKQMFH